MAKTLYSTNNAATHQPNDFGCSIAFAVSDDRSSYCFSVINFNEMLANNCYVVFDRDELKLLHAAIGAELQATEN